MIFIILTAGHLFLQHSRQKVNETFDYLGWFHIFVLNAIGYADHPYHFTCLLIYPMKADDRLDQLEPLMAEGLQKIDRLIEGQGKLVELATKTDQKADTTAKGVGNLTVKVNKLADNQTQFSQKVDQLADNQTQLADDQTQLRQKVDQVADDQTQLRQEVNQGFTDMNQRFDHLITLIQERLG